MDSMSTGGTDTAGSTSERTIAELIRSWVTAIQECDPARVLAGHTDDIVMFDVPPPEDGARGTAAYAATWPTFFDWIRAGAVFEIVELEVVAGEETAFAWALLRCGTPADLDAHPDRRLRLSLGLRFEDGEWRIAHEHHSFTHRS